MQRARILSAATVEGARERSPDVIRHARHTPAELPPRGRIRQDRRSDRHLDPLERVEPVGPAYRDWADGDTGLQREVTDAHFQRPDGAPARVAAFRKHRHDPAALQHLLEGAET